MTIAHDIREWSMGIYWPTTPKSIPTISLFLFVSLLSLVGILLLLSENSIYMTCFSCLVISTSEHCLQILIYQTIIDICYVLYYLDNL